MMALAMLLGNTIFGTCWATKWQREENLQLAVVLHCDVDGFAHSQKGNETHNDFRHTPHLEKRFEKTEPGLA